MWKSSALCCCNKLTLKRFTIAADFCIFPLTSIFSHNPCWEEESVDGYLSVTVTTGVVTIIVDFGTQDDQRAMD